MDILSKSADRDVLLTGREIYQALLQTPALNVNRICAMIAVEVPIRSKSFYRGAYNIYKHFVVLCKYELDDLLGIPIKILRFIAESSNGIFDQDTTWNTIRKIKSKRMSNQSVWAYVKTVKIARQNDLKMAVQFSGASQNA